MSTHDVEQCCPKFDPQPWQDKEISWRNKKFIKDRVRSILHIPVNFGAVMMRNMTLLEAAGAQPGPTIVLADENSLWGADVYIEARVNVPHARLAELSGTFLSRVFEGPYSNMRKWVSQMHDYVAAQGKKLRKLYFYYTTCPKCAKKYGKNYVVLLAEV